MFNYTLIKGEIILEGQFIYIGMHIVHQCRWNMRWLISWKNSYISLRPGDPNISTELTLWGRDKWTPFPRRHLNEMLDFRLKFHWSLFLRAQLTIIHYCFRWWPGADQATSHYLNQWWLDSWRIYASLGLNESILVGPLSKHFCKICISIRCFLSANL